MVSNVELKLLLQDVVTRTIEDAAFMFAMPRYSEVPGGGEMVMAGLDVSGSLEGRLSMAMDPDEVQRLAANMMGLEPDDPVLDTGADGALGELLNIVAGILVPEACGSDEEYALGLPDVCRVDLASLDRHLSWVAVALPLLTDEDRRIDAFFVPRGGPH